MKRLLFASALAAAPLAASAADAAPLPSAAQALLHQAQYWRERGRPEIARQSLERLLVLEPGNAVARSRLKQLAEPRAATSKPAPTPAPSLAVRGFRALDAGDLDAAEQLFEAARAAQPRNADALAGLGLLRLRGQQFDEAESLLAQASEAAGEGRWATPLATARFYAALQRARAARDAGDLAGAGALAQQLAASDYVDGGLARDLAADIAQRRAHQDQVAALAAWRAGETAAADRAFRSALEQAPDDPWLRYRYARFLIVGRRPDAAEAVMRPLEAAASPQARYARALYLDGQGRAVDAAEAMDGIARADRTAEMQSFDRQLACELAVRAARALGEVGRGKAAVAGLHRLAAEPDLSNAALSQLADGLFELGDEAGAAALVEQALAARTSAPSDYEGAVSVLARSGRLVEAEALVDRLAASADGPEAEGQINRLRARAVLGEADWRSSRGDLDGAIRVLRAQLAKTLDDPEALAALGRAYLASGRPDRAQQVYGALTRLRPKDEGAWRGLTAAALQARDLPAARASLARARALAPDDARIVLASAELDRAMGDNRGAAVELRAALAAHERAYGGDLQGVLDPQIARRTKGAFDLAAVGPDVSDPSGDRLREQLDRTYDVVSPSVQPRLGWAHRSGDPGLSRLESASLEAVAGTPLGGGRLEVTLKGERLDSGALTDAGAVRFGAGPLAPAPGPAPRTRIDSWTVKADYAAGDVGFGLGATSFSGRPTGISAEARWSPKPARNVQAQFELVRRPVTDSLLAYAGSADPRAGVSWGQVSRSGGQAGLTLTRGEAGAYGVVAAYAYDGRHVASNASLQLDVGGYAQLYGRGSTVLKGGLNVDVQAYKHNENAFTFGHGGYFSPQQFVSLTLPLRFSRKSGPWRIEAMISPGYEHYREGDAPVFPTAPAWQAELPADEGALQGSRKRGLGVSGEARAEYALSPRLLLGAEVGGDTFGAYRETHAGLRLRLRFAGVR